MLLCYGFGQVCCAANPPTALATVAYMMAVLILTVFILSILSLYWAVLYRLEENLRALTVQVVDFDGLVEPYTGGSPKIGPQVVQLTEQMLSMSGPSLGYQTVLASQFAYDPLKVRASVYEWDSWAAIVINPNATALLQQAVETGNASYDPTGAVQIIYQTARDSTTVSSYLSPMLQQFISQFTAQFGPSWGAMVMSNSSLTRDNLASAAAAVNPGISPLMYDLRPFQPAVVTPAVSIGLIYLIIIAFFSFSFFLPIHTVGSSTGSSRGETCLLTRAEIRRTSRSPSTSLLAVHHMEMDRHGGLLYIHILDILAHLPRLPDLAHARSSKSRLLTSVKRRNSLWAWKLRRLLDAQLLWHVRSRHCMRKRGHDDRPAVDGALAHLLGHHQRQHIILLDGSRTWVLPLGSRMAAAPGRRGEPPYFI